MVALFFALTILINEVMPAPSNAPEWVELYNPSPDVIDISGWYLDDDTHGGTQILIAQGTHIAPNELHVITFSSAILNNTGDSVTLYDASGQLIDRIDFGATKSSESISRVPDGSSIIIKTPPSPGQLNAPQIPHTATPSPEIIIEPTATSPISSTELPLTTTPSETQTVPPTSTPSPTRTPSPTITESATRTPSPTKTPSDTRTPSPTKTPSDTRTPSMSKTPSNTPLVSSTRTPSFTRTPSPTKTVSRTRTPSMSKTPSLTKTPKSSRTPNPSKTPRQTRSPNMVASDDNGRRDSTTTGTTPILAFDVTSQTPQLIVCPPAPTNLANWALVAVDHHIALPDSAQCITVDLPDQAPTYWRLTNPHGLIVAEIDVARQHCAQDISACRPSPTVPNLALHVDYHLPSPMRIPATTATPTTATHSIATTHSLPPTPLSTASASTIPLGMLLMLGGWIALKLLARPASDVLYSEADEDAASSADSLSSESRKV